LKENNSVKDHSSSILKSARLVSLMTLFSRIFGYLRDRCMSVYLGTGLEADSFTIAFLIPNALRRLFAEGSMSAAFLPTFTEYLHKKDRKESWYFAEIFYWNLAFVLSIFVIIAIFFSPEIINFIAPGFKSIQGKIELTINLNKIMFPYILLISVAALEMAILNSFHIFGLPASTPIFLNIAIIIIAIFFSRFFQHPSYAFAIGVVCGGILQLIIQIPRLIKCGMNFFPKINFHHEGVKKVALLMLPGFFAISVAQINIFIGQFYASKLAEGSVASIYYADRVMELALGIYAIAISTVILPMLSKYISLNKLEEFKETLRSAIKLINIIMIPAAIGLISLRYPIVEVLFKQGKFAHNSVEMTAKALLFFSIGLPGFALTKIIVSTFYSLKDTLTPVIIGSISIFTNLLFINLFITKLQHGSIPLASSLSSYINFLLLFIILKIRRGRLGTTDILASLFKILLASLMMFLFSNFIALKMYAPSAFFFIRASQLFLIILSDLAIYIVIMRIISKEELLSLTALFKR